MVLMYIGIGIKGQKQVKAVARAVEHSPWSLLSRMFIL